jgi:hypothetical protein
MVMCLSVGSATVFFACCLLKVLRTGEASHENEPEDVNLDTQADSDDASGDDVADADNKRQ